MLFAFDYRSDADLAPITTATLQQYRQGLALLQEQHQNAPLHLVPFCRGRYWAFRTACGALDTPEVRAEYLHFVLRQTLKEEEEHASAIEESPRSDF